MQKKSLSALMSAFALALACTLAIALSGCAPTSCSGPADIFSQSASSPAKGLVDDAFAAITDSSEENISQQFGTAAIAHFNELGIDPAEVQKAFFGKMTYEVGDATLNEDDGTGAVKVSITNVDFSEATSAYQKEVAEWATSQDAMVLLSSEGEAGLEKHVLEMLLAQLGADDVPMTTREVTLDLVKDSEGNWQLANPDGLTNAALGGIDLSMLM